MDFILIILLTTVIANLVLGWAMFRNQKHSLSNKLFLLITISIVFWATAKILFYFSPESIVNLIAIPLLYVSGISIATSFLIFSYAFPKESIRFSKRFYITTLAPVLFLIFLTVFTDKVLGNLTNVGNIRGIAFGNLYFLYVLFIVTYFSIGHFLLLGKLKKSAGILRAQFVYVIMGSSISSLVGVLTNVILPWHGNFNLFWVGPPFTIIMVVLFTYSIIKHHLLNVRVIATELFTALILMAVLVDVFLSSSPIEFAIRSGMFIIILIFGVFLIRGTLREIRELERLSEAKSTFVSIASHQLRAPLTAIKGFISMIKEGSGSEGDRAGWLDKAYISNERLIQLVNDLLNVSRIERGKIKYNFKDADIVNIIDEVVEEFYAADGFSRATEFKWKKPEVIVPELRVDAGKLRQVFINLIDNAIRYTNQGWIGVRVVYLGDLKKVRIVVQDTGIGMSKEDMRDIFELFERGAAGQKASVGGMGIGLYFAKEIIKAHRGRIWAESDGPGKGSKFIVELPV